MAPQLTRQARRDLAKIPKADVALIRDKIEQFCATGAGDVRKIHGYAIPTWALHAGNWRVLYRPEGATMTIVSAGDRRDVYRD